MDIEDIFETIKNDEYQNTPEKPPKKRRGPKNITPEKLAMLRENLRRGRETSLANRQKIKQEKEKIKHELGHNNVERKISKLRAENGLLNNNDEILGLLKQMSEQLSKKIDKSPETIKAKVETKVEQVEQVETKVEQVETKVEQVETKVEPIQKKVFPKIFKKKNW